MILKSPSIYDLKMHFDASVYQDFMLEDYRSYLKIQGLTRDTQKFYISYLYRFIEFAKFNSIQDFDSLLKLKVAYNNLPSKKISNNTIDKYYKSIKKYSLFLLDGQAIENKHFDKLQKVKINSSLPKSLSSEDIEKVYDYVLSHYQIDFYKYRNYTILQTFLNTGVRRNELVHIRKEDVSQQHIKINNGKGSKDRIIYITKEFSKMLGDYLKIQNKSSEYLFCDYHGNKLDRGALSKVFTRIRYQTKVAISPHVLRHTYASKCVKNGVNLYTLQQQMGHTDLKTTSIYLYLNSKENWEEMQKLSF